MTQYRVSSEGLTAPGAGIQFNTMDSKKSVIAELGAARLDACFGNLDWPINLETNGIGEFRVDVIDSPPASRRFKAERLVEPKPPATCVLCEHPEPSKLSVMGKPICVECVKIIQNPAQYMYPPKSLRLGLAPWATHFLGLDPDGVLHRALGLDEYECTVNVLGDQNLTHPSRFHSLDEAKKWRDSVTNFGPGYEYVNKKGAVTLYLTESIHHITIAKVKTEGKG